MSAGSNTWPRVGALRHAPRPIEPDEIPVGAIVRTPTGQLARVIAYRGFRRDFRVRLVCRYLRPVNKRYDIVMLVPELVQVVEEEDPSALHPEERKP